MPSDPQRVQAVFLAAVELPAADRAAVLDRECGADADLRRRVEVLLKAHDESGSFLDAPATAGEESPPAATGAAAGARIGPYTVLEKLGEGGMGTVYLAQQEEPVKRRVALKVIKPGMDTDRVIA